MTAGVNRPVCVRFRVFGGCCTVLYAAGNRHEHRVLQVCRAGCQCIKLQCVREVTLGRERTPKAGRLRSRVHAPEPSGADRGLLCGSTPSPLDGSRRVLPDSVGGVAAPRAGRSRSIGSATRSRRCAARSAWRHGARSSGSFRRARSPPGLAPLCGVGRSSGRHVPHRDPRRRSDRAGRGSGHGSAQPGRAWLPFKRARVWIAFRERRDAQYRDSPPHRSLRNGRSPSSRVRPNIPGTARGRGASGRPSSVASCTRTV